jgi:hypothetical protein
MDTLGILGIIMGILGIIVGYYFYVKHNKEFKILKENVAMINNWVDAGYRIEEDTQRAGKKRGKLIKTPDGKFAVHWEISVQDTIGLSDKKETSLKK